MKLSRAATLCVAGLNHSIDTYCEWLDYSLEEQGEMDDALAASWGSPNAGGLPLRGSSASVRTGYLRSIYRESHTSGL
jgi:hypothetical protein